jgi:cell division protein FtsN
MSKDYKATNKRSGGNNGRGTGMLMMGILIGLVLGLGIALGVAWYINKMPSPFTDRTAPAAGTTAPTPALPAAPKAAATPAPDKPRFDFYKILPGAEEPMTDQQLQEAQRKGTVTGKEVFLLQEGAFQNAGDADSLKARLALLGIQATVETTNTPDKGTWYRVRTGPYAGLDEANSARATLKQSSIEATLIRVREAPTSN